ncbi:hypothetical protein [Paraglaciecola agarilytica]|mgnify:FL=1|nr:hypothetical protein [Paraglaciecola agarilytica]|tara:strand:- start:21617 stop:22291 length:675 start_codon:yes stop_codon:yes gene_type:complete
MTEKTVTIDQEFIDYVVNENIERQMSIEKKYLPVLLLFLVLSVSLGVQVAYEGSLVNYDTPAFVSPDRSVTTLEPVYRPTMSLSSLKRVSEVYTGELLSLHFRQLDDQLENIESLFASKEAYKTYYLEPLSGGRDEDGSIAWIASNNIIVDAYSPVKHKTTITDLVTEGNETKYSIRTTAVQSFRNPSGKTITRFVTMYMRLVSVPRAVNLYGLQIEVLSMRKL